MDCSKKKISNNDSAAAQAIVYFSWPCITKDENVSCELLPYSPHHLEKMSLDHALFNLNLLQ